MKNKAVVLGCNYYIGLSTIRCLGTQGIHTVAVDYSNENNYGARSKYCNEQLIAPHYKEDPDGLFEFLKEYGKKQEVPPVLIPCHDTYVEFIDKYYDGLREYYLIAQAPNGLNTVLMNKDTLYQVAKEAGVRIPETVYTNEENYIEKVESLMKYPCIVKPVDSPAFVSRFRRKIFLVNNRQELQEAVKKANDAGLEVFVQRIIPGFDDHMYTFDAYLNRDSKVTHWSTCQKYRQFPINFGASVYTGQRYVPELREIGQRFLEQVGYKGFGEIEFKKDAETGEFYLIEINVRITNFNTLLNKIGLNMPYITYRELTGQPLPPKAIEHDTGVVFWYAYEDLLAIRDYLRTGQLTLGSVIKSFFKPKAYAIWDWKDPAPGFAFLKMLWGKVWKKVTRK